MTERLTPDALHTAFVTAESPEAWLCEHGEDLFVVIRELEAQVASLGKKVGKAEDALKPLANPFNWDNYRGSLRPHVFWKGDDNPRNPLQLAIEALAALREQS